MTDYAMPPHVIEARKVARRWCSGAPETPIRKDMAMLAAALKDAVRLAERATREAARQKARAERAARLRKLAMLSLWKVKQRRAAK